MEIATIIPHIEALIFASEKPLSTLELADLVNSALGFIDDRATLDQVETAIEGIREKYASEFYAFEILSIGGGWQFLTKKDYHKTVALLNGEKFLKRLSVAALETLAIIAYKQPITKSEIETIRGVNCDYAVQKLLEKELVIIAGRNEAAVGKPLIYTTSRSFMDYFGINSPEDLPKIREVLMEEMIEGTRIGEEHGEDEDEENAETNSLPFLVVNEEGDIIENNNSFPGEIEYTDIITDTVDAEMDLPVDKALADIPGDETTGDDEIDFSKEEFTEDSLATDEAELDEELSDENPPDDEIEDDEEINEKKDT